FILASYNVGPGHVLDAQKIATYLNKNPQIWENNVADCLLLKSQSEYFTLDVVKHGYCRGEEAYKYVKRIMNTYQHYQTMES
ncbi:MAG: lytic transglycosylase F, partial [Flavobacteriales bacterium]|nr:lytic transglycosylase F [Flavobacteriales bacterium]